MKKADNKQQKKYILKHLDYIKYTCICVCLYMCVDIYIYIGKFPMLQFIKKGRKKR